MHDPVKPGVGALLAGVLADLASVLEVLIFVVPAIHAIFEFLIAGAGEEQTGGKEEDESGWVQGLEWCYFLRWRRRMRRISAIASARSCAPCLERSTNSDSTPSRCALV